MTKKERATWKDVIIELYESSPSIYVLEGEWGSELLMNQFNLDENRSQNLLSFLEYQKLIERVPNDKDGKLLLILTKKGFEVALELEKHKENSEINRTISIFTAFILVVAMLELNTLYIINELKINWGLFIIFLIIIFIISLRIFKK